MHFHLDVAEIRILLEQLGGEPDQRHDLHGLHLRTARPREHEHVLHQRVERVDAGDDLAHHLGFGPAPLHAAGDDLDDAADAGERILDLVREHSRHLAEPGKSRLLTELLFHADPPAQVVEDPGESPFSLDDDFTDGQVKQETCCRRA